MDDNTFILLYRKSIHSRVFMNEGLWKVWTWCLMKASYKKRWVSVTTGRGRTEIEINPGQFIFGRKTAASELKMKLSTVNDRMKKLKKMENIDIQPDTHYSLISIINWGAYQVKENKTRQATRQATDNQPTGNRQPTDTNNKVNKEKKVNKDIPPLPPKKKKPKKKTNFTSYLKEKILENNFVETKDKIFEFYNYRMGKTSNNRYNSNKGIDYLFKDLNGCRDNGLIISDCIDEAMGRNWLTPKPSYFKNNNFGNNNQAIDGGDEWLRKRKESRARGEIE